MNSAGTVGFCPPSCILVMPTEHAACIQTLDTFSSSYQIILYYQISRILVFFSNRKIIRRFSDKMQLTICSCATSCTCLASSFLSGNHELGQVKTSLTDKKSIRTVQTSSLLFHLVVKFVKL